MNIHVSVSMNIKNYYMTSIRIPALVEVIGAILLKIVVA